MSGEALATTIISYIGRQKEKKKIMDALAPIGGATHATFHITKEATTVTLTLSHNAFTHPLTVKDTMEKLGYGLVMITTDEKAVYTKPTKRTSM